MVCIIMWRRVVEVMRVQRVIDVFHNLVARGGSIGAERYRRADMRVRPYHCHKFGGWMDWWCEDSAFGVVTVSLMARDG